MRKEEKQLHYQQL